MNVLVFKSLIILISLLFFKNSFSNIPLYYDFLFNLSISHLDYYVSVGMPLYNEVKYLERAILSVLNQTLPLVQIVIGDDCSTDGSYELALQYAQKYSNIKVFRLPNNMGTYVSRREVAYHSNGDYIFELDPDDLISPFLCEIDYKVATRTGADFVIHEIYNHANIDGIQIPFYKTERNYTITYDNSSIIKSKFVIDKIGGDLKSKFVKRTVYVEAFKLIDQNFPDNYILYAEDRIISGGICLKSKLVVQLPYYLYYYRCKRYDTSYERASKKGVHHQMALVDKRLSELYGINKRWTL